MRKQSIQEVRHVYLQCDNLAFVNVLVHLLEADRSEYNDAGFVCMIVSDFLKLPLSPSFIRFKCTV